MDDELLLRYSRQITLPEFDIQAQEKLNQAQVLIIGLGGLGAPAVLYLASGGVGELVLSDYDRIDLSNLARQVIYNTDDVGKLKTDCAKKTLERLNPEVGVKTVPDKLSESELIDLCSEVDIVLDCTDNFASRFVINDACVRTRTTLISGSAIGFDGQISSYNFGDEKSPCYRCLYPDFAAEEPSCVDNGILGPVVGIMGVMQALETIKNITNIGTNLNSKLLVFDGLHMDTRIVKINQDPNCPVCT